MVIAMRLMRSRGSVVVRSHAFRRFPAEARREDGGQQDQQHNAGDFPEQRLHDFYNSRGFCYSKPGKIKGSNRGIKQSHRIAASNRNQRLAPVPLFTRRQADWILRNGSLDAEHLPPAIGRHILQLGISFNSAHSSTHGFQTTTSGKPWLSMVRLRLPAFSCCGRWIS